ncbi:MAG: M15 family metallopeptidase [Bacilli bacterium]
MKIKNLKRYFSYQRKNKGLSLKNIILNVNMNLDQPFYTNYKKIKNPYSLIVLCNKYNKLPKSFIPNNLVKIPILFFKGERNEKLNKIALTHFIKMAKAAKKENLTLKIISGYRTHQYQTKLYNTIILNKGKEYADKYSARPGFSEHETGLAIDINDTSLSFEESQEFKWLKNNAHCYGFILRYPKDKETITGYNYEPWHYRFLGIKIATIIKKKNLTLEEYYALYIN